MEALFVLFVLFFVALSALIGYITYIIKKDDWVQSLQFLSVFVKYGLLILIISQVVITIVALFSMINEFYIITLAIKQIISTLFFINIYTHTKTLMDNLNDDKIFTIENSITTKNVGLNFLYLSLTEIIVGFIFGIMVASSTGNFSVATNSTIFVYVIVGLVLQIISKILYKATEIYEENQLTI